MLTQLHADPQIEHHAAMAQHLDALVKTTLARFGGRITRVEAHLSDENGATRATGDDIHCTLQAHLVGLETVVVKGLGDNPHQAIDDSMHKLKRAVGTALAKQVHRGTRPGSLAPR